MSAARLRLMLVSTNLHCLGVSVGKVINRVRTRADRRLEVVREEQRLQAMEREIEFMNLLWSGSAVPASDKPAFVLIPTPPESRKWWELWK